jgi:ABC-2 type transport system permease protein
MQATLLIARREIGAYLRTWTGYIILALVLFADGLLFNVFAIGGADKRSSEVLSLFFYFSSGTTMIASVFISMRLLAEEQQTGTIALLYSSPVRDASIVVGKFLGAFGFLAVMTLATAFMPALIMVHGKVAFGHVAAGYLGLLLLGSGALAIGTFASSLTRLPIVSAVISGVSIVALLMSWLLARVTERPLSEVFSAMAFHGNHFQPFQSGIVHLRDVVYYLAITYVALFAATRVLEARRWR